MDTFSGLFQRNVIFFLPDGKSFSVKLLPVLFFEDYKKILEETEREITSVTITDGRKALRELITHVWPEDHRKALFCFDYPGLCNVARVLFFGEEYSSGKHKAIPKKKAPAGTDVDLSLSAGRIMHAFPAFDLEKLSLLPLPVFLELDNLASRIQADDALSLFIPSIAAGMGSEGIIQELKKTREYKYQSPVNSSGKKNYSQEELEKAIARLTAPQEVTKVVKAGMILME